MSTELDRLYQQVILDHAKDPHGRAASLPSGPGIAVAESRQYNPLCGDEVTLSVAVTDADGGRPDVPGPAGAPEGPVVDALSWTGEGCSISQAATSVLHDLVVGEPVDRARAIVGEYREMVRSRGKATPDEDVLGDAVAFAGVGRHANRVKCAMLGWTAFEDALLRAEATGRAPAAEEGTIEA